jgi:hypothetical protein
MFCLVFQQQRKCVLFLSICFNILWFNVCSRLANGVCICVEPYVQCSWLVQFLILIDQKKGNCYKFLEFCGEFSGKMRVHIEKQKLYFHVWAILTPLVLTIICMSTAKVRSANKHVVIVIYFEYVCT